MGSQFEAVRAPGLIKQSAVGSVQWGQSFTMYKVESGALTLQGSLD